MQPRTERHLDMGTIHLPKRFDIMATLDFRLPFVRLLMDKEVRRLAVNLSDVDYIDSMGIGTLISWDRLCKDEEKSLVLERCDPRVLKLLRRVGVDEIFRYA